MPPPPWANKRKTQNRRSAEQEKERAAETGGKVQPGSGSSWRAPHDVVTPEYLEELKYTDQSGFTLRESYLLAQHQAAQRMGREAKMIIEFRKLRVTVTMEDK